MKAFDLGKFGKALQKANSNIQIGFTDPKIWISTGNYCLNYAVSGDFHKGFPLEGKMTLLAGESGSSKSYIACGSCIKWCQQNGVQVIVLDTEHALDSNWIRKVGVDPTADNILRVGVGLIDDMTAVIMGFLAQYKADYKDTPFEEKPPILFIIDSFGMSTTAVEMKHSEEGNNKGDMGLKQKQLYSLCRTFMASIGDNPIGMLCTQHTYDAQDLYATEKQIVAGGKGIIYTPSVIAVMKVKKLKDGDSETSSGVKGREKEITGVRVEAMLRKTRYNKPYQQISFEIPYDTGMNPYSGLFDMFTESLRYKNSPILVKNGAWVVYYDLKTGEEVFKKYRKDITHEDYDRIMADYMAVKDTYIPPKEDDEEIE